MGLLSGLPGERESLDFLTFSIATIVSLCGVENVSASPISSKFKDEMCFSPYRIHCSGQKSELP